MGGGVNIYQKARRIKLLVTDVDGVLTGGEIIYDAAGRELKLFNARDGMLIVALLQQGIKVAILSGRISSVVDFRAKELGIPIVRQLAVEKLPALRSIMEEAEVEREETAFVGDDLNDLTVMREVGLVFAPADAAAEAKKAAHYVTRARGGEGVIREVGEIILRAQGKRAVWLKRFGL